MKPLLFALIAATFSAPVAAEWVKFAASDVSVSYVDLKTLRITNNLRRVWVLLDRYQKDLDGAQSMRSLSEFDCKEDRHRVLDLSGFSGHMARGDIVYSFEGSGKWMHIAPNNVLWDLYQSLCAK